MSAKCKDFNEFYPLLIDKYNSDVTLNKEEFKNFLNEYFIDPEKVYSEFLSGIDSATQTPEYSIREISSRTGQEKVTEINTPQQAYIGKPSEYNKMKDTFIKDMVGLSIYDLNKNQVIVNNPVGDTDVLNNNIFNYKVKLLNTISKFLKDTTVIEDTDTTDIIEQKFEDVLAKFENVMYSNVDTTNEYKDAYNAFIILKFFDALLDITTKFIAIRPEYKKSSKYSKYRYIYKGPEVKQFTSVFDPNEFMDASDSFSDLSKILLNYFPEIDSRGQVIQYTSIGENAFKSITNKLLSWAKSSKNLTVKEELKKQTQANWSKLIDIYKQELSSNLINNPEHIIRELYKLNAIQKYLFNPETNESIRFMFIHYMNKTVQSSYISYGFDNNTKRIAAKNLTERPIKMQATFLDTVVAGATMYWKQSKNKYEDILKKYNITVNGNTIQINDAIILQDQFGRYSTNTPIENLDAIVNELGSLLIEDNFEDIANSIYRNKKNKQQLYLPFIATIIHNVSNNDDKTINFGQKQDLARVLGVINGSDVISVIKNAKGNNLPLYQMLCLVYRHLDIHDKIEREINDNLDRGSIYNDNLVYLNIDKIASPKIRTEVSLFGKTISSADLNADDCMHVAMVYDFYQQLVTKQSSNENQGAVSGVVGFQTHVYSDKNKHFVMQFDLNQPWEFYDESINFKDLLTQYLETADKKHMKPILDIWFKSNQRQINTAVNEIIRDYNTALGTNFISLEEIKTLLANSNIDEIRHKFFEKGMAFVEEIHASKSGINETLEYLYDVFNNKNKFNKFVKNQLDLFIREMQGAWNTIKYDDNLIYSLETITPQFIAKDGTGKKTVLLYDENNNINPVVLSYFVMDSLLSNEYNKMMVGNVYNHANKMPKNAVEVLSNEILSNNSWEQGKLTKEQQQQFDEQLREGMAQWSISNRWIAQIKRMVIYGATYHSYAQGLKKGVPRTVKMACISDIGASVFNMVGQNDKVDSMDGSGLTSPYLSRWENVSLIDAAVGENKKTIYHDIGGQHGHSTLLKWAEYAITNNIRRKHGEVDGNVVFRKMHSLVFDKNILYHRNFDNLYFRDKNTGKYYRILSVTINGQNGSRVLQEYTKEGKPLGNTFTDTLNNTPINTIYNIDALFGGAWAMQYNDITNNLQYSEVQNDYVNDIICDNNLKEYLIGWLVNKSAVKVGQANLNSKSAWTNSDALMYTEMSTEFGGLQMDADHDLDEAEVTEASQMISALEQNGYTHDIAMAAYNEIGKFCFDAIADIQKNISENDKEALYNIFGKAVIKAFAIGEKDTLGLAQTFVKLAQESIKDNKLQYQIPFSSSSINGIFNSTVTSSLVKDAIRRHYNGVPAVLNPSYNMVQFFNIGGNNYSYEELIDLVAERTKGTSFEGMSVDQLMETPRIQIGDEWVWSPFVEAIAPDKPVDVEDTIIVMNPDNSYQTVKIDNYLKYSFYRNYCKQPIYRWTIKGRNLKGSDTVFTIGDRKYSAYESSYNQLLTFINSDQINTPEQVKAYLKKNLVIANEEDIDSFANMVVDSFKNEVLSYLVNKGVTLPADTQIINWTYDKQSNQFLLNTNTSNQVFYVSNNIFKKELVNKQQKLLENIADNREFNWYGQPAIATNVNVIPAQIIMGKLYAKQLGLLPGDTIAHIKSQGWEFFKGRMMRNHLSTNSNENSYDWLLTDGNGNKLYVKLRDDNCAQILESASNMSDYLSVDGKIYYKGKELCSSDGKEFFTYNDGSEEHNLVIVDSIDRFREIANTNLFTNIQRNYQPRNYISLVNEEFNGGVIQIPVKIGKKIIYKNIAEFDTAEELIAALKQHKQYKFNKQIEKLAKQKYEAFEKSLLFVGTRIPCQSMQSFAPMEVVLFDDTDTNQVYISPTITWLQGSDYDIDKQYIMGYTISDNGSLTTTDKGYLKEDGLKNRVVDKIMEVIRNPKNQINLTQPITTDRIREIADRSLAGAASRTYGPFRPSCRYMMQIENMVGKKVIGNVATAIKSFFALSNVYNEQFKAIKNYLLENNYDKARELLNRYTFKYREKRITLANVNVEGFIPLVNNTDIPEDIRITLANIIEFQSSLDDQSMLLGELLNSATDNAKELTLKKINADTNWVDIYTTGFMLGESLDSIADLMLDPYITEVLNGFNSSIFDRDGNTSKIAYIQSKLQEETYHKNIYAANLLSELLDRVKDAEELRILGRILKINQGIPTNTVDQFNYIKTIEGFIESAYNSDVKSLISKTERLGRIEREMDRQANEEGSVYPETSEKYDNLLSSIITTLKEKYFFTEDQIQAFIQNKSNHRNRVFITLWERFNLLKFIEDRDYANIWIDKYEGVKRHFNILDVIDKVPHFREMFKVLDVNTRVLNTLSTRNHLENIILNSTIPNGDPRKKLSTDDIRNIRSAIDDHIIKSWLADKDLVITIAPNALDNVVEYQTLINNIEQIIQFRRYVESFVIPLLKEKLPNNKFIQQLIFGVKNSVPFYKLPFNMMQIENTSKTKLAYEEVLRDFNKLNNIKVDGIDMNLVDVFYLYNLIVNKDKFGSDSLTRIFEDVLSMPGNENLLVYNFNKWLDEQDPMLLAKTFTYPEIEGEDKEYYSDLDSSIGFKSEPTESDIEESQIESASDTQVSNAKDLISPITKELNQHVKNNDKNKVTRIIKSNSQLSSFAERPFKLYIEDNNGEIVYDFRLPIEAHDVSAGTLMLLDRTYPTFKTVEGAYQATKLQYQNELSESEINDLIIKLANASGLEARELGQSIQITDIEDWNEDSPMILKELIKASFMQNPKFIGKLLSTNDDILISSKFNNNLLEAKYLNLLMEVRDELKPSRKPQAQQLDLFTDYYDTKPSVRAELIEKIKAADMKGLHIVYDSDLVNDDSTTRNAKGFIRNGEIYINVDRATNDTVIHEFGHLYLADAKLNRPNEYYELLSEVRKTNIWQRMRSMIEYQNKRGSDFDEEVLATIISDYYKDNSENPDSPFSENANIANRALDLVSSEFKEFLSSDTIPQLSDALITNYKDQQKLATVKNQLTKDNIIKEDCK